jgi:FixJ family two-component response regulator
MNNAMGHVYLLDDNDDIRLHLGDALRQHGWAVSVFAQAKDFLSLPHWPYPAALVLDMRMPEMNGLAVQRSLQQRGRNMPIIFISGESQSQEIIDAMKSGAVEFLWKPFELDVLLEAIHKALALDTRQQVQQHKWAQVQTLYNSLSSREKELFPLLLQGLGNKDIAEQTGVLADTVKKHRASVLSKMQVDNLASLLQLCQGFKPHNPALSS